jgi:hypothetical protein
MCAHTHTYTHTRTHTLTGNYTRSHTHTYRHTHKTHIQTHARRAGHYWYLGLDTVAHRLFAGSSARIIAAKVIVDSLILGPLYVVCADRTDHSGAPCVF